jgi:hypothetical protein
MKQKDKILKILYIAGVVLFLLGLLDPLEGSVVIAAGAMLIALSSLITRDRHRKLFLAAFIMIIIGVFFLFYFSSLGGFGGKSDLSWWWGTLILPYPAGWLMDVIVLAIRWIRGMKKEVEPSA